MTDLNVNTGRIKTHALNSTMGEIIAPLTMRGRVADPPRDLLLTNSHRACLRRCQA
jgi:hypothetical protein